ncbi:MAG: hemin uptake protein HemP [Planctomycetota bacterium]|nr:MAG: hemin uptake protein HemP [Planctomycetota bacterium]
MSEDRPKPQCREPAASSQADRIVYRADELLQGRREVWIEHAGEMYRLRITAAGNLYLTK